MTQEYQTWHYDNGEGQLVTVTDPSWDLRDRYSFYFFDDDDNEHHITMPICMFGWWAHPAFLYECDRLGIEMKETEDLVDLVNKLFRHGDNSNAKLKDQVAHAAPHLVLVARVIDGETRYSVEACEEGDMPFDASPGLSLHINRVRRNSGRVFSFDYHSDNPGLVLLDHNQIHQSLGEEEPDYYLWEGWDEGLIVVPNDISDREEKDYFYKRMNYTFKPHPPKFLSMPNERTQRYFGMELEVSTEIGEAELQSIVTEIEPKQEPFFYMKDDSSLSGDMSWRYEIVTHPMTARRMRREWRTLFRKLHKLCSEKDMVLEDVIDFDGIEDNGLHIHVSKDAFTRYQDPEASRNRYGPKKLPLHLNKFVTAWNQWDKGFLNWMKDVTHRCNTGDESEYFFPHHEYRGRTLATRLRFNGHDGSNGDYRHAACHTQSGCTAEVRVFAGIPDIKHILSCLDLVDAMVDFTSIGNTTKLSGRGFIPAFTKFVVENGKRYPNAKETLSCV